MQNALSVLNQQPKYGTVSPRARVHRSGNQEVQVMVSHLIIILNDSLENFFLPPINKTLAWLILRS